MNLVSKLTIEGCNEVLLFKVGNEFTSILTEIDRLSNTVILKNTLKLRIAGYPQNTGRRCPRLTRFRTQNPLRTCPLLAASRRASEAQALEAQAQR